MQTIKQCSETFLPSTSVNMDETFALTSLFLENTHHMNTSSNLLCKSAYLHQLTTEQSPIKKGLFHN